MSNKVVLFCDHTIGYDLAQYLLSIPDVVVLDIYSNKRTSNSWWKDIFELENSFHKEIKIYNRNNIEEIKKLDFDYLFLFSWKHIVPEELLNLAKNGVVNLHYSLLPKHRGVYPINWALIQGDIETGVTFHFVDKTIDGGDIIGQKSLTITSFDTVNSLLSKLDILALELFKELWERHYSWDHIRLKQNERESNYHSKADFVKVGEITSDQIITGNNLINLIRGKSFDGKCQLLYRSKGDNYFINIDLTHSSMS